MTILTSKDIGSLVRKARKAQGLRQDELAGVANVGTRFIVDLEAGKPTVQLEKVLSVLAALGCRISITSPRGLDPAGEGHEA
ncbi:MAG: helix-turn-helix transcriptional regulator [Acidobacteria bacterium]|nr:helix-turn-helix transcriptional regulator [Acidobacteriota bacterium]